jgi:hypothetical protein
MESVKSRKTGGFAQGIYQQSSRQLEELDTVRELADGRVFAYAQAGASDLAVGKLTKGAAPSANASDEVLAASAAAGAIEVSVTFGGAVTADFYKDGWLWINDDAGEGYAYRVKGHPAGTAAVAVSLKDPLRCAITAGASTVSLVQNRQKSVVVAPATLTGIPVGAPVIPVTAGYYFWNQVKGPCPVLTQGTIVIGNVVGPSASTPGAVAALATTDIIGPVGDVMAVNASTEYSLVNLAIPGY